MVARDQKLGANGGWMAGHERKQPVRRRGGDNFEFAEFLEFAEGADDVAAIGVVSLAQALEALMKKTK